MATGSQSSKIFLSYKANKTAFFFSLGMWWRILYGILRIFLGISLWAYAGQPFQTAYYGLMAHELIEDPNDILIQLAGAVLGKVPYYITHFLSAYLIFWGIVDVSLSASLLKEKLWAFPVSIILIAVFMLYELYRLSYTHSITLGAVIIIDAFIIWLIHKKYRQIKLGGSLS